MNEPSACAAPFAGMRRTQPLPGPDPRNKKAVPFGALLVSMLLIALTVFSCAPAAEPSAASPGDTARQPEASELAPTQDSPSAAPPAVAAPAEGGTAAAPAAQPVIVQTVDADQAAKAAAAAKAEAERKEKREQEKQTQLAEAEEFVQTADETVTHLPYPLNILLGVSFYGITLWRFLAAFGELVLAVLLYVYLARHFRRAEGLLADGAVGKWRKGAAVAMVTLRRPAKIILCGLLVRGVSTLLVTRYHHDILWVSNMLVFLGMVFYFYDLAGIVDTVYGGCLFHANNRLLDTVRPMVLKLVRLAILVFAGMHIYQDITGQTMVSVIAGLGIGGVALALASQETLRNLFGFASIAFDKAFLVGDTVNIADYEGTVEHVGMRSMRVRTYDGRSVVIPNNNAINSNIVNFSRRPYIRREILVYLSPANPVDKVERAIELIREAVESHDGKVPGLPPVVRFLEFQPARFVIQALFWYDADKPYYADECSRINLDIARRLCEAGVAYAER